MADFTDDEIKAARALCDAATPGPWIEQPHPGIQISAIGGVSCDDGCIGWSDAAFIAAARTLLPAALDALEEERAQVLAMAANAGEAATRDVSAQMKELRVALAEAMALAEEAIDCYSLDFSFARNVRWIDRLAALKAKVQP